MSCFWNYKEALHNDFRLAGCLPFFKTSAAPTAIQALSEIFILYKDRLQLHLVHPIHFLLQLRPTLSRVDQTVDHTLVIQPNYACVTGMFNYKKCCDHDC